MSKGLFEIPNTWYWAILSEIGSIAAGGTPSTKEEKNFNGDISWLTPADLSDYTRKYISHGKRNLSEQGLKNSSAVLLPKGSILFSSRAPIGYVVIAENPISTNQGFKNITVFEPIFNEYVYYYLKASKSLAEKNASGTTFLEISASNFSNLPIPIPPVPEQHRIIANIEELFTKLDAGMEALKQVQAQLKRYRQSVLKAAVEGRLTAEWREQHNDELEPVAKLLELILKERHEKWETEQLSSYEAQDKTLPKNWQKKYKQPILPNTSSLPELPESWKWVSIDQISYEVRYGSSSKTNTDSNGIPLLTMGNIVEGNLVFDKLKYLPENHGEFPNLLLDSGDLLFNRTNSVELVGKTAVYKGYPSPCSYASYLIRVRFSRGVEPNFISFFINSVYGRAWIRSVVSQQVGQANVNGTKLKNLAIPFPPFDEQMKIVSELERIFSIIFESESLIQREINCAQSLRQSILKRSFEGKLVPQDPSDEPASVLLERIKDDKAKTKKSKRMEML